MALVRSLTVDGVTYPEAYSRLVHVHADKTGAYLFINTYADEAARMREDEPIQQEQPVTDLASLVGDLYPKAYEYLKTLPEFAGASDHPITDPAEV